MVGRPWMSPCFTENLDSRAKTKMSYKILRAVKYSPVPVVAMGLLQVKADSGADPQQMIQALPVTVVRPKELPIYDEPKLAEYQLQPEGSSSLRDSVSVVRKYIWKFSDTFQGAVNMTKRTYQTTEETFQSVVKYIKTEEGFYPRAGVISIAGMAGLVLARKGGFIRKVVYSGGLMTATASLCYPYKAVRIAKTEMEWVKTKASEFYQKDVQTPVVEKVAAVEAAQGEDKTPVVETQSEEETSKPEEKAVDESQEDHGQSKPEDKDMYTTRS
ncbi:MICOS complex subunit MIC27-like [Diadema antillarum]|uniref:MICOS complex subunit MIC27-like n=1 Tax=Diadema antillarum TaxID=105358 RepID=UPI003A8B490B